MAFFYHSYYSPFFFLILCDITRVFVSPWHDFSLLHFHGLFFHSFFLLRFLLFLWHIQYGFVGARKGRIFANENRALLGQGPVVWRDLERCAAGREKPPETCWRQYVLMITFIVVTSLAKHLQIVIYRSSALRPRNDMIALHFIVCIFLIDAIFSQ